MIVRPLTLEMALEVAENLSARDRAEILRSSDPVRWAHSRVQTHGIAWGLQGEVTFAIFGVALDGPVASLWIAGREGWQRYVKHVLRVWRAVREEAGPLGVHSFRCRIYEDNAPARRMVEHLGFCRGVPVDGLVPYGMLAQ